MTGLALAAPPDWMADATCATIGPDDTLWFPPDRPGPADRASIRTAKAICAICPSRAPCAAYALAAEQPSGLGPTGDRTGYQRRHGIYGGLTPGERHRMAGEAARAAR